jgi:hypothetical protein
MRVRYKVYENHVLPLYQVNLVKKEPRELQEKEQEEDTQEMAGKMQADKIQVAQAVACIAHQQFDEHVVGDKRLDIAVDNNGMLHERVSSVQCYLHSQEYPLPSGIADDYRAIRESDCANRLTVESCMDWTY